MRTLDWIYSLLPDWIQDLWVEMEIIGWWRLSVLAFWTCVATCVLIGMVWIIAGTAAAAATALAP